jgi:hypothetical protein
MGEQRVPRPSLGALAKTYEYRIFRGRSCVRRFLAPYVHAVPLGFGSWRRIRQRQDVIGEHDFVSLAASDPDLADRGEERSGRIPSAESEPRSTSGLFFLRNGRKNPANCSSTGSAATDSSITWCATWWARCLKSAAASSLPDPCRYHPRSPLPVRRRADRASPRTLSSFGRISRRRPALAIDEIAGRIVFARGERSLLPLNHRYGDPLAQFGILTA